jgi:hypothetical protein
MIHWIDSIMGCQIRTVVVSLSRECRKIWEHRLRMNGEPKSPKKVCAESLSASQDSVGVQVRHHLRGRRDGRNCGWINEMKVARMQFRRMHTDQRDCVAQIVNGDQRISLGIVVIADGSRQLG